MILKQYEINKTTLKKNNIILLYGKNEELKKLTIDKLIQNKNSVIHYDQNEIFEKEENFHNHVLSKSLFEEEKIIIIRRANEKLIKIIDQIDENNLNDLTIIIDSENLEKKSKLRNTFEKNKKYICVAFYPDTYETLKKLSYDFLKVNNLSMSPENINLILNRSNGDRKFLFNELNKIRYFSKSGKKINTENISKLSNLIENFSVSELVDNCLAKNKKKIINILNENNFNNEDCILIIRTLLNKTKKTLKLSTEFSLNRNIELTISSANPPIFWKDKEIVKQQIFKWTPKDIRQLIYKINDMELLIKKNINNSIILITDFILKEASPVTNN